MNNRPNRDTYFITMALVASLRSTCLRSKVGAVIVKDKRILSTGYNGAPRGFPHCTSDGCRDDLPGCKATVHAELNAILSAAYHGISVKGAILYTTISPCQDCARAMVNAGIAAVVTWKAHRIDSRSILARGNIPLTWTVPLGLDPTEM